MNTPATARRTLASAGLALAVLSLATPGSAQPGTQEVAKPWILPGEPFERLAEDLQGSLATLDPLADGWDSETRSSAAQAQLARITALLEHSVPAPGALEPLLAEGFRWSGPRELAPVPAGAAFRLARPVGDPGEEAELGPYLELCRRSLAGALEVHVKLKTIEVVEGPAGNGTQGLSTRVLVLLSAHTPRGTVQVNALWRCGWSEPEDGPPRLARLEVLQHEEVESTGREPLLADCTQALLGAEPCWEQQLLPGLPAWRARLDTRLGLPLLGHAAGIAVGDVDGDGLEDLYLCQPGGLPNKLLLHRPDGTLVDGSAQAGVDFLDFSRSALLLDLDGDGDRDLVVTVVDQLLMLSNDGKGRFWLEAALPAPFTTSLAAADFDLDGDLDLYACAYASPYDHSALPLPYQDARNGKPNFLLENQGDWIFLDVTEACGLQHNNDRFSFAASWEDYDDDGDPDLYVANDFGRNNLYRNDADGDARRFVDVAAEAGVEDVSAGMGVSWGDYDGDGHFDLYVSNMYSSAGRRIAYQRRFQEAAAGDVRALFQRHAHGNTLFRNTGDGRFLDVTAQAGVEMGRWAWGALFCDLDADGWLDLLSPNGFVTEERADDL